MNFMEYLRKQLWPDFPAPRSKGEVDRIRQELFMLALECEEPRLMQRMAWRNEWDPSQLPIISRPTAAQLRNAKLLQEPATDAQVRAAIEAATIRVDPGVVDRVWKAVDLILSK